MQNPPLNKAYGFHDVQCDLDFTLAQAHYKTNIHGKQAPFILSWLLLTHFDKSWTSYKRCTSAVCAEQALPKLSKQNCVQEVPRSHVVMVRGPLPEARSQVNPSAKPSLCFNRHRRQPQLWWDRAVRGTHMFQSHFIILTCSHVGHQIWLADATCNHSHM